MRTEAIFELDDFTGSSLDREAGTFGNRTPTVRSRLGSRIAARFRYIFDAWRDGRRRRRDQALLMQLSDHHLKDIGLSRNVMGPAMRHGGSALDRI